MPKSVLNATRVLKVTQTTKKYGRDTIIENQPSFRCNSNFSDMSVFLHRWAVHGKAFFWIQTLPMDGPWVDHAWPCKSPWDLSTGSAVVEKKPNQRLFPNFKNFNEYLKESFSECHLVYKTFSAKIL